MVYLWVKDRSLAEDMLQSVFEKAFEREDELQKHPNLSGWLVKSLKNEVLLHFRQNKKFDSLEGLEQLEVEVTDSEQLKESVKKVMLLLQDLPFKQREIFQLREVEGLSYEEIAAHLEISMEQVKVNLHRARLGIRKSMINQKLSR